MSAERDPLTAVRRALADVSLQRFGVAVSGGSDSLALLHLMWRWARENSHCELHAVTVNHGLRPEAADEAQHVAAVCAELGVPHTILSWDRPPGPVEGNLQDAARRARYQLIADWARFRVDIVALGHTADDQAETFLMRLARGSGLDGLSAMALRRYAYGGDWVRPLLTLERQELRAYLRAQGITWCDDPSNDDPQFERVRMRQALALLDPLGISGGDIAATARRLCSARMALEQEVKRYASEITRVSHGDVVIEREALIGLNEEMATRLVAAALAWVGGADYPPRRQALDALMEGIRNGRSAPLGGCRVLVERAEIRVAREYQAVRDLTASIGAAWDGRWWLLPEDDAALRAPGLVIRALGEAGLAQCPDWRACGVPRLTLLASPGIWCDDVLVFAPLAGVGHGWRLSGDITPENFQASILSH